MLPTLRNSTKYTPLAIPSDAIKWSDPRELDRRCFASLKAS